MSLRRVQRASVWSVLLVLGVVLGGCATSSKPVVADDAFGVLVMAHGGSQQWNDRVLAAVAPLRERYKIDVAFGMADAASLQNSVSRLEAQGVSGGTHAAAESRSGIGGCPHPRAWTR